MRIAIFDEGVNEVSGIKIKGGYNFRDGNINCIQKNDHGTAIAKIIKDLNNEVELYSIVLPLKKDSKLDEEIIESICSAIDWCIDNKIKIINISLGFNEFNDKIDSSLRKAYDNGIIVVCACGNNRQNNLVSFPACSRYVISVSNYNPNTKKLDETSSNGNLVDFSSIGVMKGINAEGKELNISGTSYASPYLVGIISQIKDIENLNMEQVKETLKLKEHDNNYGYGIITEVPTKIVKEVDNYNKCIKFKYNTHIIKYGDSIIFELEGDLKYKISVLDENVCSIGLGNTINSKAIGETYIILEDIYGRINFTHVIISATEETRAYNEIKETEDNNRSFHFKELGISKLHSKGIRGKGIKIGLLNCGVKDFMDLNITKVQTLYNGSEWNGEPYSTWTSLICSETLGVAPESEIYSIKAGDMSISWTNAKKSIDWCISNKMDIVFFYGVKDADSIALLNKLEQNGIIAVGCYMYAYNNKEQYWSSNENFLNVGYVSPDNKIVADNTKNKPIQSDYIDCLSYGYGIKSYKADGSLFSIPETWYPVHSYRSMTSSHLVIGMIALMKQQYPEINTTAKFRKLLPYLCSDLGYGKKEQGYGLLKVKLREELPNIDF